MTAGVITSCEELTHWKRLWCWEGLGAGGERDDRGWDDWMASRTRWMWVWVNSRSWWWTGRPGIHGVAKSWTRLSDWTELNWTIFKTLSEIGNWSTMTWKLKPQLCWLDGSAIHVGKPTPSKVTSLLSAWWAALAKRLAEWGWWGLLYEAESGGMRFLSTKITPQWILGPGMKTVDGVGKPETTQVWQEDQHEYWRLEWGVRKLENWEKQWEPGYNGYLEGPFGPAHEGRDIALRESPPSLHWAFPTPATAKPHLK